MWGPRKEVAKERGFRTNQTCLHLDLGLAASRALEKKFLLLKALSLWYFGMAV